MARERYLLHAGDDTIHDPNAMKKADTPQKKWDNFWYYHKIHVVIIIAALAIIGYSVWTVVAATKPDYTVGMITRQSCPDAAVDAIQDEMEKYGRDLNGDGKVIVQINQYSSDSGTQSDSTDTQMQMATQVKMESDISSGTSILFITDDASLQEQEKNGNHMFAYNDGSTPKDNAADYDKMRVPFQNCPKLKSLKAQVQLVSGSTQLDLPKNLNLSLRAYYGTGIEGKEKSYYDASKELFKKLTQG